MLAILERLNHFVWGIPTLLLIIFVGGHLTVCTGAVQLRLFPLAMKRFWTQFNSRKSDGGSESYRALCTALAATVGTGNIAGVAGAIALGGPGAIFWMWVCALLGMVTKFAEAALSVRYRHRTKQGELLGGPMYMIEKGLPGKYHGLAVLYCFFGVIAAFGVGNATQVNALIDSINTVLIYRGGRPNACVNLVLGVLIAAVIFLMLSGGGKRIKTIAERLVPFASVSYIMLCLVVLLMRYDAIPGALYGIIKGAFLPEAMTGGVVGSFWVALRVGAARGVFTNEAGMGTAAIAHGASGVKHPVHQGLMGIVEVFLDTILICTLTAFVILCSGVDISYGADRGILLTTASFGQVLGNWVCIPIAVAMCLFALATILGWGLYGIRCTQYLFGENSWRRFVWLQSAVAAVCSVAGTGLVWMLAEIVNGLMAIPNLIALAYLTPELCRLVREFRCDPS